MYRCIGCERLQLDPSASPESVHGGTVPCSEIVRLLTNKDQDSGFERVSLRVLNPNPCPRFSKGFPASRNATIVQLDK